MCYVIIVTEFLFLQIHILFTIVLAIQKFYKLFMIGLAFESFGCNYSIFAVKT